MLSRPPRFELVENTKYETRNTKHETRNTKHQTPNTKHQTPNTVVCNFRTIGTKSTFAKAPRQGFSEISSGNARFFERGDFPNEPAAGFFGDIERKCAFFRERRFSERARDGDFRRYRTKCTVFAEEGISEGPERERVLFAKRAGKGRKEREAREGRIVRQIFQT